MSYQPLQLHHNTPEIVVGFIRRHLDMQFEDVHCMLRLPIPEQQLRAGCNFVAANFLLTLIGGISTVLYQQTGRPGDRFKGLLLKYYPWELEPIDGVTAKEGTDDLYRLYRNPLEHALGLQTREVGRGCSSAQIHLSHIRMALGIAKQGLPEDLIEELERSETRLYYARATIIVGQDAKTLSVESLYWGVREMIRRLASDNNRMISVAKFLSGLSSS